MSPTITTPVNPLTAALTHLQNIQEWIPAANINDLHQLLCGIHNGKLKKRSHHTADMLAAIEAERRRFWIAMASLLWEFDQMGVWDYGLLEVAEALRRVLKSRGYEAKEPEGKYLGVLSEFRRRWMGEKKDLVGVEGWEELWVCVAGRPMVIVE